MKKMIIKKYNEKNMIIIENYENNIAEYLLKKENNGMLKEKYQMDSREKKSIARITRSHILFTPAKLPQIRIELMNGENFIVKKEIEQLKDIVKIEGEKVKIHGSFFSSSFELLYEGRRIAIFQFVENINVLCLEKEFEALIAAFAFAFSLIRK